MTDTDDDIGIDSDRTEGSAKQMGGKIKEGAGKLFGDSKMKHDEVREALGTDDDAGDNDR